MVIPSFADAEKVNESLSPVALIEAVNVCQQLIGVWARTIKGSKRIRPETKIRIPIRNLDLSDIFRSPIIN
jgi:hypothetical protein